VNGWAAAQQQNTLPGSPAGLGDGWKDVTPSKRPAGQPRPGAPGLALRPGIHEPISARIRSESIPAGTREPQPSTFHSLANYFHQPFILSWEIVSGKAFTHAKPVLRWAHRTRNNGPNPRHRPPADQKIPYFDPSSRNSQCGTKTTFNRPKQPVSPYGSNVCK
jgi:hypothetical protein